MLRMERNLKKYQNALKINNPENKMSFVDLVLHMHDELIYEVTFVKKNYKKKNLILKKIIFLGSN